MRQGARERESKVEREGGGAGMRVERTEQGVGVAHGAVGDEPANGALLQAEELDVAAHGFPWAHARHDQDLRRRRGIIIYS